MEQDFLGLTSDYKKIRPSTLVDFKLPDDVISCIQSTIQELRQKQKKEQSTKANASKGKTTTKTTTQKKKARRKSSLIIRGNREVKNVVLEKVSCPNAQMKHLEISGTTDDHKAKNEYEFEFISTPFNEEIPPTPVSKLEKETANKVYKDQPAPSIQQQIPQTSTPWNEMGLYNPFFGAPKSFIPIPLSDPQQFLIPQYRDKMGMNPMTNFVVQQPRDKLGQSLPMMNLFAPMQNNLLGNKGPYMDLE